jgi:hypothetical protein
MEAIDSHFGTNFFGVYVMEFSYKSYHEILGVHYHH